MLLLLPSQFEAPHPILQVSVPNFPVHCLYAAHQMVILLFHRMVSKFYDHTISCYSFSKSLSLPGERIGYVAVNPRCEGADKMAVMCGQISRGIGHNCPASLIQLAVAENLELTADMSVYETNMNLLYNELTDLGFECVKPGGTFYIFPKALEEDAIAFCEKAKRYDLIMVPSDSFGCTGHVRLAYCIETEKVERSLEAIRKFVREMY